MTIKYKNFYQEILKFEFKNSNPEFENLHTVNRNENWNKFNFRLEFKNSIESWISKFKSNFELENLHLNVNPSMEI